MCVRPLPIRINEAAAATCGLAQEAAAGLLTGDDAQLITRRLCRSAKKRYICTPWRNNAATAIRKQTYNN